MEFIISSIDNLSTNISEVTLIPALNTNESFNFLPGQYVYIELENKKLAYSIASSPTESFLSFLVFHGKNNENIEFFKNNLNNQVNVSEPLGKGYYRENHNVVIAIGKNLGISPIKSIIDYLAITRLKGTSNHTVLLYLYYLGYTQEELVVDSYFKILSQHIKKADVNFDILYKPLIIDDKNNLAEIHNHLQLLNNDKLLSIADLYTFGSNDFVSNIYYRLLPNCQQNFFTDAVLDERLVKFW